MNSREYMELMENYEQWVPDDYEMSVAMYRAFSKVSRYIDDGVYLYSDTSITNHIELDDAIYEEVNGWYLVEFYDGESLKFDRDVLESIFISQSEIDSLAVFIDQYNEPASEKAREIQIQAYREFVKLGDRSFRASKETGSTIVMERENVQSETIARCLKDFIAEKGRKPSKKEFWFYLKKGDHYGVSFKEDELEIEGKRIDYDAFRHRKVIGHLQ